MKIVSFDWFEAARGGHESVVRALLAAGVSVKVHRDKAGLTPLEHAAAYGRLGAVEALLERTGSRSDADVVRRAKDVALRNGHDELVGNRLVQTLEWIRFLEELVAPTESDEKNYGATGTRMGDPHEAGGPSAVNVDETNSAVVGGDGDQSRKSDGVPCVVGRGPETRAEVDTGYSVVFN